MDRKKQLKKELKAGVKTVKNVNKKIEKVNSQAGKLNKNVSNSVKYRKELSSNLHKTFGGVWGGRSQSSQGTRPVGRPAGPASYKHRSPFNGQPIPATEYYKQIREFRRQQIQRANKIANQVDQQQVQNLARQGVPPEQAKQIVDNQQLRKIQVQPNQTVNNAPQRISPNLSPEMQRRIFVQQQIRQLQEQQRGQIDQQIPNGTVIPQGTRVWKFRRGVVGSEGGLFGKQQKVYGLPESFWN